MADDKALALRKPSETLPVPAKVPDNLESRMLAMVPTAGTLEITAEQGAILYKDVADEEVQIRPDGLLYLPWSVYATRLRKAFGAEWSQVPDGKPHLEGTLVMWGQYLIVKGKLISYAVGEQEYRQTNATMTWGDACEAAWSNALMRNCKHLGLCLELWTPAFINQWKATYAESYKKFNQRKQKLETVWRKKGSQEEPEPEPPGTNTDGERSPEEKQQAAPTCPKCGKALVERTGSRGKFLACPGYPQCKHTEPLPEPPDAGETKNPIAPPGSSAASGFGGPDEEFPPPSHDQAGSRTRSPSVSDQPGEAAPPAPLLTVQDVRDRYVAKLRAEGATANEAAAIFKAFLKNVVKRDVVKPADLNADERAMVCALWNDGCVDIATGEVIPARAKE